MILFRNSKNRTGLIGLVKKYNLRLDNNLLSGELPVEIGNALSLNNLKLQNNELAGEIPESICNLPLESIDLNNNFLCPEYPDCIESYVGEQDTSDCTICYEGYLEKNKDVFEDETTSMTLDQMLRFYVDWEMVEWEYDNQVEAKKIILTENQ